MASQSVIVAGAHNELESLASTSSVAPAPVETPLIKNVVKDEAFRETVLSRTPLGRIGEPAEIAAIVAWLASDQASYVTGETIKIDGGGYMSP